MPLFLIQLSKCLKHPTHFSRRTGPKLCYSFGFASHLWIDRKLFRIKFFHKNFWIVNEVWNHLSQMFCVNAGEERGFLSLFFHKVCSLGLEYLQLRCHFCDLFGKFGIYQAFRETRFQQLLDAWKELNVTGRQWWELGFPSWKCCLSIL